MNCDYCGTVVAEGFCSECNVMLCRECMLRCMHCRKPMCPDHIHSTKGGRQFCETCIEDYRARRAAHVAANNAQKNHEVLKHEGGDHKKKKKTNHDEEDNGFAYIASGYHAQSKKAYVAVFVIFVLVGILIWYNWPFVQGCLKWPFDASKASYSSNTRIIVKDTNELRNFSNVSNLDFFPRVIIFLITWALILAYFLGLAVTGYVLIRGSVYWLARRTDVDEDDEPPQF